MKKAALDCSEVLRLEIRKRLSGIDSVFDQDLRNFSFDVSKKAQLLKLLTTSMAGPSWEQRASLDAVLSCLSSL